MSRDWQRSRRMPDFSRPGHSRPGGSRLVWLLAALALMGGLVLVSAFGASLARPDRPLAPKPAPLGRIAPGD